MRSACLAMWMTVISVLLFAGSAGAQQKAASGPQVSGLIGGSFFNDRVDHGEAVTAGYRFNRLFALDLGIERTALRFDEQPDSSLALITRYDAGGLFPPTSRNSGRALLVLGTAMVTVPWRISGMRPYVSAGGGVANLRQSVRFVQLTEEDGVTIDRSKNAPAVTLGGGVDIPVSRAISAGLNLQYLRVFEERFETELPDRFALPTPVDPLRLGVRISYHF